MSPQGHSRTLNRNFSGGMFRSLAPELIPESGLFDITNGLLDEDGAIYKRGGSTYWPEGLPEWPVTVAWSGWLTGGLTTVFANRIGVYTATESAVTLLTSTGITEFGRAAALDGTLYLPGGQTYAGSGGSTGTATEVGDYYAAVANRLLVAEDDTLRFSPIGGGAFDPLDFHQFPGGVQIIGVEGLRDAAAVFTTDGIWMVRNLAYNLTDADGNVQQSMDRYSTDLILWGDSGIAGWSGALVVPALDGVWAVSLGVASEAGAPFTRISDQISDLYRSYVARGAQPGVASVFRAHYILPIVLNDAVIDTLVCRLDGRDSRGRPSYPWVHFASEIAPTALVSVPSSPAVLLGAGGSGSTSGRVRKCEWFSPSGAVAQDADGSTFEWSVTTRDIPTGPINDNTVVKIRVTYEMVTAGTTPTLQAYYGSDRLRGTEWGEFEWGGAEWTSSEGLFEQLTDPVTDAPEDIAAAAPFTWRVRKKSRYARFRLVCDDDVSRFSLRAFEMFVRDSGRI